MREPFYRSVRVLEINNTQHSHDVNECGCVCVNTQLASANKYGKVQVRLIEMIYVNKIAMRMS
jgi:hypothetical protein